MEQTTNPKHYTTANGKDLFALMEEGLLTPDQYTGFLVGNITKYLHRAEQKNGAEDLAKAGAYLTTLGVKLYGVDFGPLLLQAVGEQLAKHTQSTTLVDEDDFTIPTATPVDTTVRIKRLRLDSLKKLAQAVDFASENTLQEYTDTFADGLILTEAYDIVDAVFGYGSAEDDYNKLHEYADFIKDRVRTLESFIVDHTDTPDDLSQSVVDVIETLNDEELLTLADASTFAVRNDRIKYYQYYSLDLTRDKRAVIDVTFNNNSKGEDYEDLHKYAGVITKRLSGINTQSVEADTDQDETPAQTSTWGLNSDVLSAIHSLDVDDLTTLARMCDKVVEADKGNFDYLKFSPREDLALVGRVINPGINDITLEEVTDLLIQFRDHVKEHLEAISQADRVKEAKATDPVLERLTNEVSTEDFNNVRDLYREMLDAGITNGEEAWDYLVSSHNGPAKSSLINCFHNDHYNSDWADMVKYFGPVVMAQLQAEVDKEAKATLESKREPELYSELNAVELSALKKAYRDIIELDTADKRTKYFHDNSTWVGVPLVRAFNNNGYRDDVTDLLNWGFYNVTAGLPIPKSKRTEDPEHLALLNKVYHLIMFKYTVEDRQRAIIDTSDDEFSWGEAGKVADITTDLLDDGSTGLISEDVRLYFIDNPDQATYK